MARFISTLGVVHEQPVVTLPPIAVGADFKAEAREIAKSLNEKRIIRTGAEAWEAISKSGTFENWKVIGAALLVGKQHTLRVTGANAAWGRLYSHAFSKWMKQNGFGSMRKCYRSVAIELSENLVAIEQWRATLPEKQRKRLRHATSNVKAWRKSMLPPKPIEGRTMDTDKSAIYEAMRRLRLTMTPNQDVQLICDELEKLIGSPPPKVAPLHPLWTKEPPSHP